MHFFAGLTFEEIALQFGVSTRTVMLDWTMARAWLLFWELSGVKF
jgi:DNA-directed RNA polymerase specialized sigma24 family protein